MEYWTRLQPPAFQYPTPNVGIHLMIAGMLRTSVATEYSAPFQLLRF
jgi:hypothetical protein